MKRLLLALCIVTSTISAKINYDYVKCILKADQNQEIESERFIMHACAFIAFKYQTGKATLRESLDFVENLEFLDMQKVEAWFDENLRG